MISCASSTAYVFTESSNSGKRRATTLPQRTYRLSSLTRLSTRSATYVVEPTSEISPQVERARGPFRMGASVPWRPSRRSPTRSSSASAGEGDEVTEPQRGRCRGRVRPGASCRVRRSSRLRGASLVEAAQAVRRRQRFPEDKRVGGGSREAGRHGGATESLRGENARRASGASASAGTAPCPEGIKPPKPSPARGEKRQGRRGCGDAARSPGGARP